MKIVSLFLSSLFVASLALADSKIVVHTNWTGGSFDAISTKVKGTVVKNGEHFSADQLTVAVESFDTDNSMRNTHFREYLKTAKVVLTQLKGFEGKATADLEVAGVKKPITGITYKEVGENVEAAFTIKCSTFGLAQASYLKVVTVDDEVEVKATLPFVKK